LEREKPQGGKKLIVRGTDRVVGEGEESGVEGEAEFGRERSFSCSPTRKGGEILFKSEKGGKQSKNLQGKAGEK